MNIHRHFVVLVSAAIPEGHLDTNKLDLFVLFMLLTCSQCDSVLVSECRLLRVYTSINLCMWRILCTNMNIYSL